jgi:hypothetical protein
MHSVFLLNAMIPLDLQSLESYVFVGHRSMIEA